MSAYKRSDMKLLEEAYNVRLLKEQAPNMTLVQLEQRVHLMSESELVYINTVMDRILNEFWGQGALSGLKNVGSAAAGGIKSAGKSVGQAVGGAVGNAAQKVANVGRGVGAAGKAGAQQVASNVGNIYQKGKIQQRQSSALDKGLKAIEQLRGFIQQVSAANAQSAAHQGFGKGAASAMKQAYRGSQV